MRLERLRSCRWNRGLRGADARPLVTALAKLPPHPHSFTYGATLGEVTRLRAAASVLPLQATQLFAVDCTA